HNDFCALTRFRFQRNRRTVLARDPARDGKAEAGTVASAARALTAEKALKYPRQLILPDADPRVVDGKSGCPIRSRYADVHFSAWVGELHRVVEEDHRQLTDERRVAFDRRFLEVVDRDLDIFLARDNLRCASSVDGDVVEENSLLLDLALARVRPREDEQAVDYPAEPPRLSLDPSQRGHVIRRVPWLLQCDFRSGA